MMLSEMVSHKIRKKVKLILELQSEIRNWEEKSEDEISTLLQKFEKLPRDEFSNHYSSYFTEESFAQILIKIAKRFQDNNTIQKNIISSLGNMMRRYHLRETKELFDYFKRNAEKKNISAYVAIHYPHLEGFKNEETPWNYYMSIRKLSPKKIAEAQFLTVISEHIHEIPEEFREEVLAFLSGKKEAANNEGGKKYYQELIEKIESLRGGEEE